MERGFDAPGRMRLGVFEVDLVRHELRKKGRRIHLQPLPFRILSILIRRRGEIVTREELRNLLWPEDTYVDFEHGLNTAIRKLRHTLEDSAAAPRFVETVPRVGYRFIAAVEEVHEAPQRPTAVLDPQMASDAAVRRATSQLPWLIVALMSCGLITAVWFATHPPRQPAIDSRQLTTYPGQELEPALSPDGSRVAFSWDGPQRSNFDIYVKSIGAGDPLRLTADPRRDFSPAWSPGGASIAFLRELPKGKAAVIIVPPLGGGERQIAEVSGPGDPLSISSGLTGPFLTWSPDERNLIVSDKPSNGAPASLVVFPVSNAGQRRRLTTPEDGSRGDSGPALSPDGSKLAFVRFYEPGFGRLFLLPLGAGLAPAQAPKRLMPDRAMPVKTPAWTADGKSIVFAGGYGTRSCLWMLPLSGFSEPLLLTSKAACAEYPTISHRNGRLVWVRSTFQADIVRLQLPARRGAPALAARLIVSTCVDNEPSYSPDGRRIAFTSDRSGSPEIWTCDREGGHPVRMTSFGGPTTAGPRWSPDGKYIAFDSQAEGRSQIYVMESQGHIRRKITRYPASNWAPSWSRDGKWIYYTSDHGGHKRLWKVSVEGGGHLQVTSTDAGSGFESADEKYLYYARLSAPWSVWRIPRSGGAEHMVISALAWPGAFELKREGIYFVSPPTNKGGSRIAYLDLVTGRVEMLAEMGRPAGGFAVCPDGQSILYSEIARQDADLMWADRFR